MITLAAAAEQPEFERHRKPTRRGAFLAEMQVLVPWSQLAALIEPHYHKAGNGRLPIRLERMLRIHLPHHWFNLPDSTALRAFPGIDLGREPVPDATTLCKFRHLLDQPLAQPRGEVFNDRYLAVSVNSASAAEWPETLQNSRSLGKDGVRLGPVIQTTASLQQMSAPARRNHQQLPLPTRGMFINEGARQ